MAPVLPPGYSLRAATMDDLEATVDLLNACEIDEHGEPDYGLEEVQSEWADADHLASIRLVVAPDGALAGYAAISHQKHVLVEADNYVHPGHVGRGIGTFVVRHTEERATDHVPLAPADARVAIRNIVSGRNPAACALLDAEGYRPIRQFWRMQMQMTEPPAHPVWPGRFEIRPYVEGRDEQAVFDAVQDTFRDHWSMGPTSYDDWFRRRKGDGYDPSLWIQVYDGEEMAAVAVCRRFLDDMGWISDVGVRSGWRRRGLATAVLQYAFGEFYRRGLTRVALGVDAENPSGATRLYERAGMEIVRNFVFYEKELRPGRDWLEPHAGSSSS